MRYIIPPAISGSGPGVSSQSDMPGKTPHPISKAEPSYPAEETHFGRLYPQSRSFGHYPKLVTIGVRVGT